MVVRLVTHSRILVTSLSRVILAHYEWCLDMPNLTNVVLPWAFRNDFVKDVNITGSIVKDVNITGSTHFISLSPIDIGALRSYFNWSPRVTWLLSLCHTQSTHTHLLSTSELIQRHWRERYRCANTEIMTIRIWNDGNPIRIVETGSNDHSLHITCNSHHFAFQITHIASPFQWEPKPKHS